MFWFLESHSFTGTPRDLFFFYCPCFIHQASLEELIQHGLNALRDTLQQDKTLTLQNTSIGIIGAPPTSTLPVGVSPTSAMVVKKSNFRVLDDDRVEPFLVEMRARQEAAAPAPPPAPAAESGTGDASESSEAIVVDQPAEGAAETGTGGDAPAAGDGDGDVQMQE